MYTHEQVHTTLQHLGVYVVKLEQGWKLSAHEETDMFKHLDVLSDVSEENWRQVAGHCSCSFMPGHSPRGTSLASLPARPHQRR